MASGPHLAGELIGHYRLLGRLGAGGMGQVFLAHDTVLNREVALKFLSEVQRDQTQQAALLNEARAASRLDHPNIGAIFGLEQTAAGEPFMVMAYYEGQTLQKRLRAGSLTHLEAANIALQTARGLAAAHAQRIVHRDIKPSNIMLTRDSTVRIVDFGIAKPLHSEASTQTMSLSGTVAYLAPEQAQGHRTDHRADIWSLGVVLAEMLTGAPVFERDSHPATLYAIVHAPPPTLPALVPASLQRVVYRCLAKQPADRYQSCGEILHDLSAVTDSPISGRQLNLYRRLASAAPLGAATSLWLKLSSALAILAVALIAPFIPFRKTFFQPSAPHLAALPIAVASEDQALGDGLMETITSRLSNLQSDNPDLWIVPISEVHRFKVTDPTLAHKLLNANLVVTCTLQRRGQAVHLLLNLIDTKDLRQIGSGEFTTDSGDLSELEDQAVHRIAQLMRLKVSTPMQFAKASQPSSYESYLKAVGYLQRYDHPENLDHAIDLLKQVTAADPKFALAFSSLGEAYRSKAFVTKDPSSLPLADAAVNRAISLDSNLAEVHLVMGAVQRDLGHKDLALAEYRRTLQLDPRSAGALAGTASIFYGQGRFADADAMYRRAADLKPQYWQGFNDLGLFLKRRERYDEAAEQFKRVIQLTPDNMAGYSNLGITYLDAGRLDEAQAPLERARELSPTYAVYSNLAVLSMLRHNYEKAAEATEQALKLNDKDWMVWQNLGTDYEWLYDIPRSTSAFKRSISLLESSFVLNSPQPDTRAEYAQMLALTGDLQKARREYASALSLAPDDLSVLLSGASIYGVLHETGKAVALANKAVSKGLTQEQLKNDPSIQWLVNHPTFHQPTK